jgi:hypothetical protein
MPCAMPPWLWPWTSIGFTARPQSIVDRRTSDDFDNSGLGIHLHFTHGAGVCERRKAHDLIANADQRSSQISRKVISKGQRQPLQRGRRSGRFLSRQNAAGQARHPLRQPRASRRSCVPSRQSRRRPWPSPILRAASIAPMPNRRPIRPGWWDDLRSAGRVWRELHPSRTPDFSRIGAHARLLSGGSRHGQRVPSMAPLSSVRSDIWRKSLALV